MLRFTLVFKILIFCISFHLYGQLNQNISDELKTYLIRFYDLNKDSSLSENEMLEVYNIDLIVFKSIKGINKLPNLQSIKLNIKKNISLEEIYELQHLTSLTIFSTIKDSNKIIVNNLKSLDFISKLSFIGMVTKRMPYDMGKLKDFSCYSCDIDSSFKNIINYSSLKKITCDQCQLNYFPEIQNPISNIEEINFSKNSLEKIPNSISKLRNLRSLNLNENRIYLIPSSFSLLDSLKYLSIEQNEFKAFPLELLGLKNLLHLRMYNKYLDLIKQTPPEITKLSKLQLLPFPIKDTIPNIIYQFKELSSLNLSSLNLREIPKELYTLKKLTYINMENNQIEIIPDEIENLKFLEGINLSKNKIYKVSDNVNKLFKLKSLNLSNNLIVELGGDYSDMQNLEVINLTSNRISKFPFGFSNCIKLKDLYLENNNLKELNGLIEGNFVNLVTLDLNKNSIIDLPKSIMYLESLRRLKIDNNPIEYFPRELCYLPFDCKVNYNKSETEVQYFCQKHFNLLKY